MIENIVNRCVKALEAAEDDGLISGDWPEVVRVVMAAMREPTEEIKIAGSIDPGSGGHGYETEVSND